MENVVKHLQRVILGIITDIDALCQKNSIDYYLVGGSTIGAVRHKGFIPWDDDLDIIMTHANYEKFIKVCNEQLDREKYYFQEGRKDWPLNYSKVRLRHTRIEALRLKIRVYLWMFLSWIMFRIVISEENGNIFVQKCGWLIC